VGSIPIARFTSNPADEVAEEQLKEISRREFEQIFGQGRLDLIDETVAADYVCYDPALPDPLRGPQGLKQAVRGFRAAFPDLTFVVEEQIAEGDTVVRVGPHGGRTWANIRPRPDRSPSDDARHR
jgi:SnoaL-like polyketide cyclase